MTVRVGVDVGGTFTKAVAVDAASGTVVAQSVLPTTHDAKEGVARGVVDAIASVAQIVGAEQVALVTHSTTQAVNALLEGDVGTVGVIGLGRGADAAKARKRTRVAGVELAPGRFLKTESVFFDVTNGLDVAAIGAALDRFKAGGVAAVCVAEAFSPDDQRNEDTVVALARERGLPACASTELSGLYGLELRAVTAAINASILPVAMQTAAHVAEGARKAGLDAPVMVMRGDGGATDLEGFRSAPVRTLYSGPAASVAGALRFAKVRDGVILEVGGTSTNVAAVRDGRPLLSYVRVATHATAVRAVDVRVVGVAGGSMLRLRRRRVYGVGPRSAHIAGLPYAGFFQPERLEGADLEIVSPRAGDPADYAVLRLADGSRAAVTTTCAANALTVSQPGDYAFAPPEAACAAFAIVGRACRSNGQDIARQMLQAAGEAVCDLVWELIRSQRLRTPALVAVGGGAGGLGRHVGRMLGLEVTIPEGAEVISSIGDALSHVRAERERTVNALDLALIDAMSAEVEAEVLAAGAAASSVEVRIEEHPERGTVRAIATGAVALATGAMLGRQELNLLDIQSMSAGGTIRRSGMFWVVCSANEIEVLDRFGDPVLEVRGEVVGVAGVATTFERLTRYRGPVTLRPVIHRVAGSRMVELSGSEAVATALVMHDPNCADECYIIGRST